VVVVAASGTVRAGASQVDLLGSEVWRRHAYQVGGAPARPEILQGQRGTHVSLTPLLAPIPGILATVTARPVSPS